MAGSTEIGPVPDEADRRKTKTGLDIEPRMFATVNALARNQISVVVDQGDGMSDQARCILDVVQVDDFRR